MVAGDDDYENEAVKVGPDIVTVGSEIGAGAEGFVYSVRNDEDVVIKIFNKKKRNNKYNKIEAMVANDIASDMFIWPEQIVKDPSTGEFLGYKMPRKDLNASKQALEYAITELQWESSDRAHQFIVASNLAKAVAVIHGVGHAIGDFNHDNILIDDDGRVTLIDCDGFHITDESDRYPDDTYYPRYAPPEGRGGDSLSDVKEADQFCLGVHIFQVLMEGFHPYHAQGPKAVDGSMEDKLHGNKFPYVYSGYRPIDGAPSIEEYENRIPEPFRELFNRCFTESGKNKSIKHVPTEKITARPSPTEWIAAYRKEFESSGTNGESEKWKSWEYVTSNNSTTYSKKRKKNKWSAWDI